MIKENFIPLAIALDDLVAKTKLLARQSRENAGTLKNLDDAGSSGTTAQEDALVSELATSGPLTAWNEALRVFTSNVDEN